VRALSSSPSITKKKKKEEEEIDIGKIVLLM
jgi:hypothetical protein